ncbi:MAG: efflux transporter outer membrane subunit [Steroidobacteraceae bacterium]
MQEALQHNADLEAAEARIRAADARVREAGSALIPSVSAGASINRIQGSSAGVSATELDRGVSLSASYEPDFWGAASSARRAARAELRATRADAALLRLTLEASVVETFVDLLAVRSQQDDLRQRIDLLANAAETLEARQSAGLISGVELMPYRSALSTARAALAPLLIRETELAAALALLLGRDSPVELPAAISLRTLTVPPPVGAEPADLLTRRPDVISAESALLAADANLDLARAAFLPRLTLDVVAARQNPGFQAVLTTLAGTGQTLDLGAALTQTLFDGGKRKALRAQAQAHQEELLATYRRTVLGAFLDAQRAFALQQAAAEQTKASTVVVEHAVAQAQSLMARREAGAGDPLLVLDAQQGRLQAQESLDASHAGELKAAIGLFKALGGGWQGEARQ